MKDAVEDRSHFGAWVITSSPLILGFDVQDPKDFPGVWDIVTNEMAININQEWAGHPSFLLKKTEYCEKMDYEQYGESHMKQGSIQIWSKPQNGAMTVFVVNEWNFDRSATISFS